MRIRVLAAVIALGVLAASCGDDDASLSAEEQLVVDALVADMQADTTPDEEFTEEQMRCLAESIVTETGVERLAEVGITADDVGDPEAAFRALSDDEVNDIGGRALECIDYAQAFIDSMMEDGVSQESGDCLVERLQETDFFLAAFVAGMRGSDFDPGSDGEFLQALVTGAGECFTEAEFEAVFSGG